MTWVMAAPPVGIGHYQLGAGVEKYLNEVDHAWVDLDQALPLKASQAASDR